MYASCSAATRSCSWRVMVCLVALVESSTTNVDRMLRESTRALTTTLPNSVTWLLGICSVSSRSRAAVGFHSTDAAFTLYTTTDPPRGFCESLVAGCPPEHRRNTSWPGGIWGAYPARQRINSSQDEPFATPRVEPGGSQPPVRDLRIKRTAQPAALPGSQAGRQIAR